MKHAHLLDEVVAHKQHFFREGTAHYELAKKNTLRLAPGKRLEDGLRKDYERMREMYFGSCLSPQLDRTGPSLVFVSLEEDLSVILGPEGDASR
jgi:hypothetical protein